MKKLVILFKILLLPFMCLFEALLMATCLFMGILKIKPKLALNIIEWSKRLPDLKWYYT